MSRIRYFRRAHSNEITGTSKYNNFAAIPEISVEAHHAKPRYTGASLYVGHVNKNCASQGATAADTMTTATCRSTRRVNRATTFYAATRSALNTTQNQSSTPHQCSTPTPQCSPSCLDSGFVPSFSPCFQQQPVGQPKHRHGAVFTAHVNPPHLPYQSSCFVSVTSQ